MPTCITCGRKAPKTGSWKHKCAETKNDDTFCPGCGRKPNPQTGECACSD